MAEYKTRGVCSRKIGFKIDQGRLKDVCFVSGCAGNLEGISRLVEGMQVEEVIKKLEGIKCGWKDTSCPAQFAQALKEELKKQKAEKASEERNINESV
jgi:uncharacterized protein (TIGR03905 family)